ncbi:hypothetical protein [Pacificoceanicola onchidii]|uniref:hypothetical protein n=1 Tax=Pacificoceanicola onchidii TaxID=2562685 RepID=UPI0010A3AF97|nr:hypothetical protein [Pacificoceanicola onchidii]
MSTDLPEFYFRTRDNGAMVFRVDTENRQRRIDLDQIAVVNLNKGEIRPHGDHVLTEAEVDAIETWMAERKAALAAREIDDIRRTVDHLHQVAQWAQSRAEPEALEAVTDELLLAMHDLRLVLVRRKADRVLKG